MNIPVIHVPSGGAMSSTVPYLPSRRFPWLRQDWFWVATFVSFKLEAIFGRCTWQCHDLLGIDLLTVEGTILHLWPSELLTDAIVQ